MFEILEQCDADFICLQEVTPRFLELLLKTDLARNRYFVSDSNSNSVRDPATFSLIHRFP